MTWDFRRDDYEFRATWLWFWVTWLRARWVSGDLTGYRFDCWEILPGQLGNKLLIQWCLAPVAGIWKERERGFGCERNAKIAQGRIRGRDFNIYLMDVYAKTVVLWLLAGISLPPSLVFLLHLKTPFPLKCLPHGLSDVSQSVYLFTLFNIYQAICIFWWLELRYLILREPRLRKWWRGN